MAEKATIHFLSANTNVIDVQTFVTLGSYKNSSVKKNNVAFLKNELMLLGDVTKPFIHVFHRKKWEEDFLCKKVLSARPTAICASFDGCFVVIAIGNELIVWQPASNLFVNCPKMHFQQVTVVRFTKDASYFISAGDDGMVVIWNLSMVLSPCEKTSKSSASVIADHQLPITDVNVSKELFTTYLLSTSMDRSCRIYELGSKATILNVVFESIISVGIFGHTKNCAFLGDFTGKIYKLNLASSNFKFNKGLCTRAQEVQTFVSVHKKEITSLVITMSNKRLISGSLDKLIVIWNTDGLALKVLPQNSEITNIVLFTTTDSHSKESNMDNQIKYFNRIKCDVRSKSMELQTKACSHMKYQYYKSMKPSNNSIYKLEVENRTIKGYNANIFEQCKMLINLI